jgi:FtsP/CotA-like multicopper oxidase with cupredoxin domain
MKRRDFVRIVSACSVSAFIHTRLGGVRRLLAQIPGGTLDPHLISKFRAPLLVPPAMPRVAKHRVPGAKSLDYYEIAVRQFAQQILPPGMPATTVWGYGPANPAARGGPLVFNAPSLTIEAKFNTPVRIKWINQLVDHEGRYLPHLLPVDPTLHWANPPGGLDGRDLRPTFNTAPERYRGPVPLVTHVHGAAGIGDESDGYAEAWYLPDAVNIPDGYASEGPWYDFFESKARSKFDVEWERGSATFQYPNLNRASTLWYHDHTLGMTRLNVYAGPAGFYLLRGGPSDTVVDRRNGRPGILPGPAPALGDPSGTPYFEIPLAIQDRSFNADGSLFYPDTRAFFGDADEDGPFAPESDVPPIWNPEFFGNTLMVNGRTWPFFDVEQRRYRFRMLNGCQARFLILDFSGIRGVRVTQIGNEGGFLPHPFDVSSSGADRLLLAPAERADLIVDFTDVPRGDYVLTNLGPDEPFGGGQPGADFPIADPESTGQVLQFRVGRRRSPDHSTLPGDLVLPAPPELPPSVATRRLVLAEQTSGSKEDAPTAALLGTLSGDPETGATWQTKGWMDAITENPSVGDTETWEVYNTTADAHPIHIHETTFQVLNRQATIVDEHQETVRLDIDAAVAEPEPGESGRKDTVIAYPNQVTRVKLQFNTAGQYVWHCHIVEHEDNEMMRPYRVGPAQPGAPVRGMNEDLA